MRFGQQHSNDPMRNRKSQMRLFVQVMLLGFMLIAVQWAAKARNWTWLVPEKQSPSSPDVELKQLDFKVKPRGEATLAAGEVRIEADPPADTISKSTTSVEAQLAFETLSVMDDGRLGTLRSEQLVIDQLIQRVRSTDPIQLMQLARRDVGFVELNDRPADHRGQLLAFTGILWRLTQLAGEATPPGDELYEAWIMTSDAANNPSRILLTELPTGITLGNQLNRPVEFAGYFIKRYGYATERGTHIAPLFVSRTIQNRTIERLPGTLRPGSSNSQWIAGLAFAVFGSLLIWRRMKQDMLRVPKRELPDRIDREIEVPDERQDVNDQLFETDKSP